MLLRDDRLDRLHVYLCDFGVAAVEASGLTTPGSVAGTWNYLAPERAQGTPAAPVSDVYSVGCLLYETLTGRPPYQGTDVEVAMAHLNVPVPQLPGDDAFHAADQLRAGALDVQGPGQRFGFEDLHWADTRTLRALVHLVSTLGPGDPVGVVATRRARPQPTGALADLGVAVARHGGRTVELSGLGADDARALVAAVTGSSAGDDRVDRWCASTGGNPFFLVELARLAASAGDWRGEVPESVQGVVARRLDDLPDPTREVLLVSAALGREHSPLLLAHVGGWEPGEVADRLEAAEDQGIVHLRADGRLSFEHALTRDAVLAAASPARVARVHARIAHALESVPRGALAPAERAFDLAHHWLAAGPVHAPQAWRAAATAAAEARREFANVEASDLYRAALDAHALDPSGTRTERYDLLLAFTEAAARAARWRPVVEAVIEAVALARADEDPDRMAHAAASLTRYSAWLPQEYEEVHEDLVEDLRWGLHELDHHDSATRCTLMLALAVQLYYRPGAEPEVLALVDEGIASARRLGDPGLRAWAVRSGWLALWRSAHLDRRRDLAVEELEAAQASGDEAALALAHVTVAGTAVEDGDRDTWLEHARAAEDIARRRRLTYVEFVLHFVRLSLSVLEGDDEAAAEHAEAMRSLSEQTATPAAEWTEFGVSYLLALWRADARAAILPPMLEYFLTTPDDFARSPVMQLLAVDGQVEALRRELDRAPLVPMVDNWHVLSEASGRLEAAALVGDLELARTTVAALEPASGRFVVSGIATVYGPVDGYLALGRAVLGEPEEATALADRAEALATTWGLRRYLEWLAGHRRHHGF